MASIDDVLRLLRDIDADVQSIGPRIQIVGPQIIVTGLADISKNLGVVQSGEFRAGNSLEPGFGFTGGRFGWPGFNYGGTEYFLAGVDDDVLQVGLSLTDGKVYAGEGNVILDSGGIRILDDGAVGNGYISFYDSTGTSLEGRIINSSGNLATMVYGVGMAQSFFITLTDTSTPYIKWFEDPTTNNATRLDVLGGTNGGVATFFGTFIFDGLTEKRLEIGADHFFPTRDSSNPNGFWNEANEDMDFTFEDTIGDLLKMDAGASKVLVHGVPLSNIIGGNGAYQTVALSSTNQLALFASGFIPTGANAPMPKGGILKNLHVRIAGTQPASGSLVFDLMINNVASTITCTQAAGAGAATISDTTHTETVVDGDLIYVRVTNNATAASAPVGVFSMELEM